MFRLTVLPLLLPSLVFSGALVFSGMAVMAGASESIVYSWPATMQQDPRSYYPIALLRLALQKSGGDYQLKPSKRDQSQRRSLRQLAAGKGMDVVWTFTSIEREKNLLPIRIPIDRGLLGWRLLLVRSDERDALNGAVDLTRLQSLRAVQGHDWPDLPILEYNHFKVIPSTYYQGMFTMLQLGRVDYFPRSISEIDSELAAHAAEGLAIADGLVLYYPAPSYFFVSPKRPDLAKKIELGLRMAIADGSLQQLFLQHFAQDIRRARLNERRIIRLQNPYLNKETPLDDASLWFDPQKGY